MYKRGVIILVPFPFTDLSSVKLRPALVISNPGLSRQDVIVVFISSVRSGRRMSTDLIVTRNSKDFSQTGLKTDSVVKCNKIATLDKQIVLGEIGFLPTYLMAKVEQRLKRVLDLK